MFVGGLQQLRIKKLLWQALHSVAESATTYLWPVH